jgi:rhodanese-related sulfurtransferase
LRYTYSGIDEIDAEWVAEHRRELQIVDVREPHEHAGELGHVPGAQLVPLGNLAEQAETLDKSVPVVTVCRSGGRSAQAVTILARAGFAQVANMAGGMLEWHARGLPTE